MLEPAVTSGHIHNLDVLDSVRFHSELGEDPVRTGVGKQLQGIDSLTRRCRGLALSITNWNISPIVGSTFSDDSVEGFNVSAFRGR
jgi:hypothetical protein